MPQIIFSRCQPLLCVAFILLMLCSRAYAEIGHLPAAQPFPPEREVFYLDDSMTAYSVMEGCGFLGKNLNNVPPLSAECAGYWHAVIGLFHTDMIRYYMLESQCLDLFGEIPDWAQPIIKSFLKHANAAKPEQLKRVEAIQFIAESVAKDYPCKDAESDGATKGAQKARKP